MKKFINLKSPSSGEALGEWGSGTFESNPRWVRIFLMTSGSSMEEITFNFPPALAA